MKKILIVDDDAAYRRVCAIVLAKAGFETVVAENGEQALRLVAKDAIDLVVTDILMPEREGLDVIMTLRRERPGLKVIAISGGGSVRAESCLALSEKLGAATTLRKPFTSDELVRTVRRALGEAGAADTLPPGKTSL